MTRRVSLVLLGAPLLVLAACQPMKPESPPRPPVTVGFACDGSTDTFTVPAGVTGIVVDAYGAQGGSGQDTAAEPGGSGGLGGRAVSIVPVTPGEILQVNVGCQG